MRRNAPGDHASHQYKRQGRRYLPVVIVALSVWPQLVLAGDSNGEEAFFADLPQVVTVTRMPQSSLDTPASVTVIDRRMIEASGAVDIPDLLRLVAGFQVGHAYATRPVVTYHGMTDEFARRMQVLVDGRSVYSPLFGGVDWPLLSISMEDIDHIEVTRGPNGVTYGANSFLGVINIITLHPAVVEQGYAKVTADGAGEFLRALIRQAGRSGAFDYRFTLEHRYDAGLDDSALYGTDRYHDDSHINRFSFRGDYRAAINDYIGVELGLNSARLGDGATNDNINPPRKSNNLSNFEQFNWKHVAGDEKETQLLFYHEYKDTENAYQTALLSTIFGVSPSTIPLLFGVPDQAAAIDNSNTAERYNIEFQYRYRLSPSLRAVSGIEGRLDRVKAPGLLANPDGYDSSLYRLFSNAEWHPTPRIVFNGGAMVENNDIIGTKISPRLAFNYHLNGNTALRINYNRAYRTPSLLEEHADYAATYADTGGVIDQIWKSDGNLGAERMDAWEIGLAGEHKNGLGYDIKLFQEKMSNLIAIPTNNNYQEPNCTPFWQVNYPGFCRAIVYENYGTAITTGAELQTRYRPNQEQMVSLAWSHLFKREGQTLVTINPVSYNQMEGWRPEDTITLLGEQGLGQGWTISAMVHHVDSWLSSTEPNNVHFTTANARVSKRFTMGQDEGTVSFWVNDLLGSYYDFYYFSPTHPRSYLSVELKF